MTYFGQPITSQSPHLFEADLSTVDAVLMTPEQHFVRTHGTTPPLDLTTWRLVVDGAVGVPLTLSLEELRRRPQHELVAVLECAGNGRRHFRKPVDGDLWGDGAVSCSVWSGVRLSDLLAEAHASADVVDVICGGASTQTDTGFDRGLPLAVALGADTIVALTQDGRPLLPEHGAPARLVVPGWYGVAWVKWLRRLTVSSEHFGGYWNTERYVMRRPGRADEPVEELYCKSVIVSPSEGSTNPAGRLTVSGFAWSGTADVSLVEVSVDAGRSWGPADLEEHRGAAGWVRWQFAVTLPSGEHTVRSRATDSAGRVQPHPDEVAWNEFGYCYNASVDVHFRVAHPRSQT